MKYRILIVDGKDGKELAAALHRALPEYQLSLCVTDDCQQALQHVAADHPNVILFDMSLASMDGIAFLAATKKIDHAISVIMTTSCGNVNDTIETIRHGAFDYLIKPPHLEHFRQVLRSAVECSILNRHVRYVPTTKQLESTTQFEDLMIGTSAKMMEIWKLVGKIADNTTTVLIEGESGTGKELLAKAIYSHSDRNTKPFLAINCAALPETLLESELFGHEKGAFTDAHQRRIGKFEHCHGGTILLDEISEMNPASQSKLLRVLEEQKFERIGGNDPIRTDVRVIASTNTNLEEAVQLKRFRLDLYHRLKGVNIRLPPLRERPEDIPILIDLFCRMFAAKYGKQLLGVSEKARDYLCSRPWKGNIRELKHTIASAAAITQGRVLRLEDIVRVMQEDQPAADGNRVDEGYCAYLVRLLEPTLESCPQDGLGRMFLEMSQALEKATIALALKRTGNNQVMTAKMLGMSRNTLRSRLERYSLEQTSGQRLPP